MIASVNVAWYVARAGGLVSFGLLTVGVVAGVLLAGRVRLSGWPRFAVEDIHRFLGLLAGTFLSVHLLGLLADGYLGLPLSALVVPGLSSYRPLATALGVVGAELLLALAVTNRLRRRLAYSTWRRLHMLNFAVWTLALGHGIAAGTDSDTRWAIAVYLLASGSVAAACVWRLLRAHQAPAWAVAIWTGTASIVAAELVLALAAGPLARP
jgi:methionine sulfoxide reductase heme-binding subunit